MSWENPQKFSKPSHISLINQNKRQVKVKPKPYTQWGYLSKTITNTTTNFWDLEPSLQMGGINTLMTRNIDYPLRWKSISHAVSKNKTTKKGQKSACQVLDSERGSSLESITLHMKPYFISYFHSFSPHFIHFPLQAHLPLYQNDRTTRIPR